MEKQVDKSKIDENTLIPLSFFLILAGGVMWLTTLHFKVSAAEKDLETLNCEFQGCLKYEIKKQGEAIARIEGALGTKPEKGNQQ